MEKQSKRDLKAKKYNEGLSKIFPGLQIGSMFSLYGAGDGPHSGKISFSNQSKVLREVLTPINHTHFIHYTSVESLFNILNTGKIRLNDLNNLNDPMEMKFGLRQFPERFKLDLEEYKRTHFVSCFCAYDMKQENDEFLMWQLYGYDGKGVGLVFELTNPSDEWDNVFFGKVQYGKENKTYERLCEFADFHENFQKHEKLFENIPSLLPTMSMFLKGDIWHHEQEYRLFTGCNYSKYDLHVMALNENHSWITKELQFSISKQNKRLGYIEFPVNFEKERSYFTKKYDEDAAKLMMTSIPNLKLARVVCGYRIDNDLEFEINNLLSLLAVKKIGSNVQVGFTRLKQHFN